MPRGSGGQIMKDKILKVLKLVFNSFLWISVLVFALDVVTKQIVLRNMNVGQTIPENTGFIYLQYVINDGMAFGLNFNAGDKTALANRIIFISISVIGAIILFFIFFKFYKKLTAMPKVTLALMIAGCLGNLVDRAFYDQNYLAKYASGVDTYGVVDFIAVDFGKYQFPRFNIADSALVIGALLLIVYLILEEVKDAKAKRALDNKAYEEQGKIQSLDEKIMEAKVEEKPQDEEIPEAKEIEEPKKDGEDL